MCLNSTPALATSHGKFLIQASEHICICCCCPAFKTSHQRPPITSDNSSKWHTMALPIMNCTSGTWFSSQPLASAKLDMNSLISTFCCVIIDTSWLAQNYFKGNPCRPYYALLSAFVHKMKALRKKKHQTPLKNCLIFD